VGDLGAGLRRHHQAEISRAALSRLPPEHAGCLDASIVNDLGRPQIEAYFFKYKFKSTGELQ
jgi:hypothetical protein